MSKTLFPTIPLSELKPRHLEDEHDSRPIVLVVDDERIIADTLVAILSHHGLMAMPAYDGPSAFEIAKVIPPDLLLSDVVMPGMSGIDLATMVKRISPSSKVLLFSGQAVTGGLLHHAGESADFTVLAKPFHPKDLLVRVSQSLGTPIRGVEARSASSERHLAIPL